MKNNRSIQSVWMTWLVFAILLSGCWGDPAITKAGVAAIPDVIISGEVMGLYPGTTTRLLNLAMEGKAGAELLMQESTGNLVAGRQMFQNTYAFTAVNVKNLQVINGQLTGNLVNASDWAAVKEILAGLGYVVVKGVDVAAKFTGMSFTIIGMPSEGITPESYQATLDALEGIDQ